MTFNPSPRVSIIAIECGTDNPIDRLNASNRDKIDWIQCESMLDPRVTSAQCSGV